MGSDAVVARLAIVSLGDLVSMAGTEYTLFRSFAAAFTPRLLGGAGLISQNLDFSNDLLVGGCEDGVAVGKF